MRWLHPSVRRFARGAEEVHRRPLVVTSRMANSDTHPVSLPDMVVGIDADSSPAGTNRSDTAASKESTWTVHGGNVFGDLVSQSLIKSALIPENEQGSSHRLGLMKSPGGKKQQPASVHGATNFAANNFQASPVIVSPTITRRNPDSTMRSGLFGPKHRRTPSRDTSKAHFTRRDYSKWDAEAARRATERWLQHEENSKHGGDACWARLETTAPASDRGGSGSSSGGKVELTDYALGACLGMGAFATVHAATVRATGEKVAIKMSREAVSGSAEAEASQEAAFFRTEVGIMSTWCAGERQHAHIVRCLGHGELPCRCDGMFAGFVVMEQLPRGDLRLRLRQPVTVAEVERWARQLALALAHLHDVARVVHRDVKTSNLMLTADDQPQLKLVDFGLATSARALAPPRTLSAQGQIPSHLAPRASHLSPRASHLSPLNPAPLPSPPTHPPPHPHPHARRRHCERRLPARRLRGLHVA